MGQCYDHKKIRKLKLHSTYIMYICNCILSIELMSISRSSRSSQRASTTTRNKTISFRLFASSTHHEIYNFLDVPYDIVMETTGVAMKHEETLQRPNNLNATAN